MRTPVHQYEPHDAPDVMTRDFTVAAVVTVLCLLGAAAVLLLVCGAVGWGLAQLGRLA